MEPNYQNFMTYSNGIRASATWHIRDCRYVIKKIWSSMLGSSNVGHKKSTMCVKRCKMGPLPFMAGMGCNQMHASKSLIRQCMPIVSVLRYLPLFPVRPPRAFNFQQPTPLVAVRTTWISVPLHSRPLFNAHGPYCKMIKAPQVDTMLTFSNFHLIWYPSTRFL